MKLLKKGQVGGLQGFILSIITVAIVLAIGLIILQELSTVAKELDTSSVLNETVSLTTGLTNGTGTLSQAGLFIGASAARNASVNEEVLTLGGSLSTANVTITSSGGVTVNTSAVNTSSIRVDYTHFTPSGAFNATNSIIVKLATVPTWIGIIIIVALAFIVLSFFIGRRQ